MDPNKIIEVCSKCHRACCWYGEFMCDEAQWAGTIKKSVKELRQGNHGESEHYWSDKTMKAVYGDPAPFGFKA